MLAQSVSAPPLSPTLPNRTLKVALVALYYDYG
jgi:hypothetical protein